MAAGRLLVFEGLEGVGKTTQIARVAEGLARRGVAHRVVREPGQTRVGAEIRRLVLDPASEMDARTEALLFMASRAELVAREVRPALERGELVIADRFFLSTYAYQGAGRGLPRDELRTANRLATGGLVPDLTILLEYPVHDGLARASERGGHDRLERSGRDFHERVAAAFAEFATATWQREHPECGPVIPVDARGSMDDVEARVRSVLVDRWPETFASS